MHALPEPLADDTRLRTAAGRRRMLLIALACTLPVVASYLTYYVWRPSRSTAYSSLIQPSVAMPDVVARTPGGGSVRLRSLAGQWLTVVVHGADCDAACERLLFLQRQLREMMGRERARVDKLWLVVDDRPIAAPLLAALESTPAMHVLRLPRETVAAWLQPAPGEPLEAHLYLVDPLGEWMMRAPADPDPAKLKRDLERLLRASAGWDRPGREAGEAPR